MFFKEKIGVTTCKHSMYRLVIIHIINLKITKSKNEGKKLTTIFYDENKTRITTFQFGGECYFDYTVPPRDTQRQQLDIESHNESEDWTDGTTAGALSR